MLRKLKIDVSVNISDTVEVVLTDAGLQALKDDFIGETLLQYNVEGRTLKTELWQLMQVFGDRIYMGGPQYFVNNEITLKDS